MLVQIIIRRMKINYYTIVMTEEENGMLTASVPSLPGCHTQAKTQQTLLKRIQEAIELYLEVNKKSPKDSFIGIQQVKISV